MYWKIWWCFWLYKPVFSKEKKTKYFSFKNWKFPWYYKYLYRALPLKKINKVKKHGYDHLALLKDNREYIYEYLQRILIIYSKIQWSIFFFKMFNNLDWQFFKLCKQKKNWMNEWKKKTNKQTSKQSQTIPVSYISKWELLVYRRILKQNNYT